MRNITKIFIVVFSLILLFAVSCSNDDKTGVKNNPPEDMEITDGETGSGSGSGSGSETGGSGTGGDSGTETGGGTGTGGDSGTETGGGSEEGEGGTETGGGSEEGEGGTETGGGTETPEPIDAKDFPTELLGRYKDDKLPNGYHFETEVSTITELGIQKTKIEGSWLKDGTTADTSRQVVTIEKWKQTKKGGNPIKLEGESSDGGTGKYTVIYDYASGTLSGKYTHPDGTWSFSGKK